MEAIGQCDPGLVTQRSDHYAVLYRVGRNHETALLENWKHTLTLGGALPTLPLWLSKELAVPLELEESNEETCRILRIP